MSAQDDQLTPDRFLSDAPVDINKILQLTMALARIAISEAAAASVTVRRDGELFTSTYDVSIALEIDEVQYSTKQGPCVTAVTELTQQYVPSVLEEPRWPDFAQAALERGMKSNLATPMVFEENAAGALNLYSRSEHAFREEDQRAANLIADYAGGFLSTTVRFVEAQNLNEQLYEAILSREVIGEAKGILMMAEGIGPLEAFQMLRKISMDTNTPLREIARRLVETQKGKSRRE